MTLKIRIERKLSRRMVCVGMGSMLILLMISMRIMMAWALNVISRENGCKTIKDHTNRYHSTQNFTINLKLKAKFLFRSRILEKL